MNIEQIIKETFNEMVEEISLTVSSTVQPQRYHETSSIAEINNVYQFVKILDKKYDNSSVYLEYPCDSGRVDAVVVLDNNLLLIEAKCEMTNKKYKELNAQASRFENNGEKDNIPFNEKWLLKYNDSSLLESIKRKFPTFINEKWNIKDSKINMYGILLSDTTSKLQALRWGDHQYFINDNLTILNSYNYFEIKENNITKNWWHLCSYKQLNTLK